MNKNVTASSESDEFVLGEVAPQDVRVRYCPSPTGNPHVGVVRAALYNWAFARHFGGTFVFRIEDTDAARDSEESYNNMLEAMRWLGLEWDEGVEAGGPFGPYRQSLRMDLYADIAERLRESGHAYDCYCTPEELDERREAARAAGLPSGYDGKCRDLTDEQVSRYQAEGRTSVLRMRTPDRAVTFTDMIRGDITVDENNLFDYVLVRANGQPLYPLVNPVDDALMQITHVLRGEDLLSSTPRQIVLHEAMRDIGVVSGPMPRYGHLPLVKGDGNRKLSKRDPESSLSLYRERGFLPEGLLNYLALLGWSIGDDQESFSLQEMADAFDVTRVNSNAARFDLKKAEAINGVWLRQLSTEDLTVRITHFLRDAGVLAEPTPEQSELIAKATPLVQERISVLADSVGMLGFLFAGDVVEFDEKAKSKMLKPESREVLVQARDSLAKVEQWETESIETTLRGALIDGLELKPKKAFGPVRVAVTGRLVSPPLFESLELLGQEKTLRRIDAAIDQIVE